jgi:hypothetical protein
MYSVKLSFDEYKQGNDHDQIEKLRRKFVGVTDENQEKMSD